VPIALVLQNVVAGDPVKQWLPAEHYTILADNMAVGAIRLRIGDADSVRYIGHVGYSVDSAHQGRGYATLAIREIANRARRHDFQELWITIRPDNIASQRACLKAGARYVDTVAVPAGHDLYERGDREMQRYRLKVRSA
jgi:predicted acetyltransferase